MICDIQSQLRRLKKERGVCVLAHSYTAHEILEAADFTGDSYALSVKAKTAPQKTVVLAGVRFMAETVKIISPEKTVILVHPDADCPMAECIDKETLLAAKKEHPGYKTVAYINTTAELKTVCDVCVTSSSAVRIVRRMEEKNLIFIPDCDLGSYVRTQVPEKNILLLKGGCPVHASVTEAETLEAKRLHPDAPLLVHPECVPAVVRHADYVGSTSGIMDYVAASPKNEFIIGTEISIAQHLQYAYPDRKFYGLSKKLICPDMRLTTLLDVYNAVAGAGGEEIALSADTLARAKKCIDEMIRLGG